MRVARRLAALSVLAAISVAVVASSSAAPAQRKIVLGVFGDPVRFQQLTGQRSITRGMIVSWTQGHTFGSPFRDLFSTMGEAPMIGLDTTRNGVEAITPLAIAQGKGDEYLIALNHAIGEWRGKIYVRPFGEMNGHWNAYCAFEANGRQRGPAHTTRAFRKAFARTYLIIHGGSAARINARLRKLGLPPIRRDLAVNPFPRVRVVWNPQGFGSPNIRANSASAYYPGPAYVDVVGNDLYHIRGKAMWSAADALYRAYPRKPHAFPEWGLWGLDDPAFIRRMATFVRTHPRVELISFYESERGSIFDLASKPRSRAAYRCYITPLG